jgi:hypothetical protein
VIDRTPKPCLHKRASHQHGDRVTYVLDRCRCLPCCHAASVYEQARKRRNAYGRSNYVDAGPVREHVTAVMAAGIGLKRIVAVSGVSQGVLWKLMYGKNGAAPSRRVTHATAGRLLALDPSDRALLADGARIDSTGTRRRLQAMACLGWSTGRIAAQAGVDRQALDQALAGGDVTARTARAIAAVYGRLWGQQPAPADRHERGGITRTINRARRAGWPSPLAWDDETIDDPAARPDRGWQLRRDGDRAFDEVAVERAMAGDRVHLRPVERAEAVYRLTEAGLSAAQIGERLGIDKRSVQRIRDQRRTAEDAA